MRFRFPRANPPVLFQTRGTKADRYNVFKNAVLPCRVDRHARHFCVVNLTHPWPRPDPLRCASRSPQFICFSLLTFLVQAWGGGYSTGVRHGNRIEAIKEEFDVSALRVAFLVPADWCFFFASTTIHREGANRTYGVPSLGSLSPSVLPCRRIFTADDPDVVRIPFNNKNASYPPPKIGSKSFLCNSRERACHYYNPPATHLS